MNTIEELEKTILDQIEKLSDDSIAPDSKDARVVIEKSRCMSELASNIIEMKKVRNDEARVKIDAVRAMHETSIGNKVSDRTVQKYLGIGED